MNPSKSLRTLALALLAGLAAPSGHAEDKVISWATNPKYPPYDWSINGTQYEGACTHLLELVIPKEYTLRPVLVPWARAQKMAEEGSIDLLVNLRVTPERSTWLEFSKNPTFSNPIAIFMRRDQSITFKSWNELKPLTGGVTIGDAFGNGFDEFLKANLKVEPTASPFNNFRKLDSGRIDYFVTGYYMGMAMLSSAQIKDHIVALRPFVSDQAIHLGFSKRSPYRTLLPEIDRKLAQLTADGTLAKILNDHLLEASRIPISVFSE
ncbi:substrate-binding periplasmic protein [Propionivibrio dicarboxylicus]|uniref:Polar amino acid transport system substrate-binding protein n=1 Tax=Propionivibrio dicarboxylicus TaxID=83767 RepID=A0A1G7Y2K1_9RHOO|nr:transporter substrate-binding domain-containing protein [Propionivibrio dicarboxylicus]SDG90180.1 polar amino acid transport system substrate-binding protein [Propionivibrio dicarboxylicus]